MARAKVIHSDDVVMIQFKGDRRSPEPSTAVIEFPGGHVEVSRCTDGSYWAHLEVIDPSNIAGSRLDYVYGASKAVTDMPEASMVKKLALRITNTVPRFDPDA